jgi:hypothetical protein
MKKLDPQVPRSQPKASSSDLARRLARYRSRVEAEGRKRSLLVIDRAISDAKKDADENS